MSNIVKTWDISGMLFPYENDCQKMLWTGIKYLSRIDNAETILQGTHGLQAKDKTGNIIKFYSICFTPESFNECEKLMEKAVDGRCTGAMYEAVVKHLRYIANNGLEKWHEELRTARKGEQQLEFNLEKMELV